MTINDPEAYVASLWDWGPFDECFGDSRIKITDVDGMVEHHGQFLLIETKLPGVVIPEGQRILFDHLVSDGRWRVLIIWGHPGVPEHIQLWGHNTIATDLTRVKRIISRWYRYAHNIGFHI
jgi:hypothetical protein